MRTSALALATCLLGAVLASPAAAVVSKIAVRGDEAPGGNGEFRFLGRAYATDSGHVLFRSSTTVPGGVGECLFRFRHDGSDGEALLCKGDSIPLDGMDVWTQVPVLTFVHPRGNAVFRGDYLDTEGLPQSDVFHYTSSGVLTRVDAPPGPQILGLNDSGTILISATGAAGGLYSIAPGGTPVQHLALFDPLPDDPTRVFAFLTAIALGPDDEIAFVASAEETLTGLSQVVAYRIDDGVFTRIATQGASPGAGIAGTVSNVWYPLFSDDGSLYAQFLLAGTPAQALLEWNGTDWSAQVPVSAVDLVVSMFGVAGDDDLLYGIGDSSPSALTLRRDGETSVLVSTGEPAPGTGGGTFGGFLQPVSSIPGGLSSGTWAVTASIDGGSGDRGVFAAGPPSVPALPAAGWGALAGILAVVARLRAMRRRS